MNKSFKKIAAALVGMAMAIGVGVAVGRGEARRAKAANVVDVLEVKTFDNVPSSYTTAGTEYGKVGSESGVQYYATGINSSGSIRGNKAANTGNFNLRNSTTYENYYLSKLVISETGGTMDPATNNRSVLIVGSSVFAKITNATVPSGTQIKANETSAGTTLTFENSDTSVSYFQFYSLKTSGTCSNASIEVTWAPKSGGSGETVHVEGVSLPESLTVEVGENETLKATVTPANADDKSVSWESSNDNIASVDQTGKVTGVANGTATITATSTDGGKTATCAVTVVTRNYGTEEAPLSVKEANDLIDDLALEAGKYAKKAMFVKGVVKTHEAWTSYGNYDNNMILVDENDENEELIAFRVKANTGVTLTDDQKKADGIKGYTVVITGTATNYQGTMEISSSPKILSLTAPAEPVVLTGIEVTTQPTKLEYEVNDVIDLSGMVVTASYSEGEPKVIDAFTTNKDEIDMSTPGQKTITVSYTEEGVTKTAEVVITVNEPVLIDHMDVTFTGGEQTVGQTLQGTLKVEIVYTNNNKVDVTDDVELFTKELTGAEVPFTANTVFEEAGEVTIFVRYLPDGASSPLEDSFTVTVVAPQPQHVDVESVSLNEQSKTIKVDDEFELVATVLPTDATNKELDWSIEQEADVVSLTNGVVKGLAVGSATVTATSVDNPEKKASCVVTVEAKDDPQPPVDGITYSKVEQSLNDFTGRYLIVNEDALVALDGSLETIDAANDVKDVAISNGKIVIPATVANDFYFDIAKVEGGYSIKAAYGYYIGHSGSKNTLNSSDTAFVSTIEIDSNENAVIGGDGSYTLRYNDASNQNRFRYYTSGQKDIQLYKMEGDTPAPQTYTVSFNSGDHGQGEMAQVSGISGAYTLPACTFTTEDGYEFAGWTVNNEQTLLEAGAQISVSDNVILTAHWELIPVTQQVTITLQPGEAGGQPVVEKIDLGTDYTLPANPFAVPGGKEFAGWLVNNDVKQPGDVIEKVGVDLTIVAQWQEKEVPPQQQVVGDDIINAEWIAQPEETTDSYYHYFEWEKSSTLGTEYKGNTAAGSSSNSTFGTVVQLRSNNNNSGIVVTKSVSVAKAITFEFNVATKAQNERKVDVYGSHTAYAAPSDLYAATTQGTLLGSAVFSENQLRVKLSLDGDYEYIGFRSNNGAIYLDNVKIAWGEDSDTPVQQFTVSFDANGGSGEKADVKVDAGGQYTLPANPFTAPEDKEFAGWKVNGEGDLLAVGAKITVSADVRLVAQWKDATPIDPSAKGTADNPYTPAEANTECAKYENTQSDTVYVAGIVSEIKEISPKVGDSGYGNATFYISDDGTTNGDQFYVYRAKNLENADFTSEDQLKVGDQVVVVGKLTTYVKGESKTPELAQGGYLYSRTEGTTPQPGETYTVSFSANDGSGTMADVTGVSGEYTLPACGFTAPEGKEFAGWKVNGEGDLLAAGAKITVSANVQLVAQWKDAGSQGGETPDVTGKTLESISVTYGGKSDIHVGEQIDVSKIKVTAKFTDGTEIELALTDIQLTGFDSSKAGVSQVTVTYTVGGVSKTATFNINVNHDLTQHDGCHSSIIASSALISITTLIGAGLLLAKKRKEQ